MPRLAKNAAMIAVGCPHAWGKVGIAARSKSQISKGSNHMGQLDGRVALVTGGGRGIGRGISELLAAEGATVAVNYRRDAEAAAEHGRRDPAVPEARPSAFQASVDDPGACATMIDAVVAEFGGLDILVCNAGIASRGNSVADTDPAEMIRVVAAHAFGPHHLARLAVPHLRVRGRGDIVMISSIATSNYSANGAPYNMGKAAMEALAFTLAKEERANGIHVNVVAPGPRRDRHGRAPGACDHRRSRARGSALARCVCTVRPGVPTARRRQRGAVAVQRRRRLHHRATHRMQRRRLNRCSGIAAIALSA